MPGYQIEITQTEQCLIMASLSILAKQTINKEDEENALNLMTKIAKAEEVREND